MALTFIELNYLALETQVKENIVKKIAFCSEN